MGSKTKLSSPILYCMTAGHKINQETAKGKESKKVRAIKFIQVELLYKYLTTTPLKINIFAYCGCLNFQNAECAKSSGKGMEIPQNVSTQVMNRSVLLSLPCLNKIPDYPKNLINNILKIKL